MAASALSVAGVWEVVSLLTVRQNHFQDTHRPHVTANNDISPSPAPRPVDSGLRLIVVKRASFQELACTVEPYERTHD